MEISRETLDSVATHFTDPRTTDIAPASVRAATLELAAGGECLASLVERADDAWRVCWLTKSHFIHVAGQEPNSMARDSVESGEDFDAWVRPLSSVTCTAIPTQAVGVQKGSIESRSGYTIRFADNAEVGLPFKASGNSKYALASERFVRAMLVQAGNTA